MSRLIAETSNIVDQLKAQYAANESDYGSGFAPANQHEIDEILRPGMLKELEKEPNKRGEAEEKADELDRLRTQFEDSLNPHQSSLKAALDQAREELEQQRDIYAKPEGELGEHKEEVAYAESALKDSLNDDQAALLKRMEKAALEVTMASEVGDDLIGMVTDSFTAREGVVLHNPDVQKEMLSMNLSGNTATHESAHRILEAALKRMGVALDEESEISTGYIAVIDYPNQLLHLIKTADAATINFDELKHEIETSIKAELGNADKWKKMRSTRGLVYQYTSPYTQDDLTQNVMWVEDFRATKPNTDIKRGVVINGVFKDRPDEDDDLGAASKAIRVSGDAIKDVLVDKLGISNLLLPSQKQVG